MPKVSMEQKVEEIWARQQILDLMVRWCRGVDRCDPSSTSNLYWEDGTHDHGAFFRGSGSGFARYSAELQLNEFTSNNHFMTNHLVEFDSKDKNVAYGESYCLVSVRSETQELTAMVRMLDRFECREGEWRIAHRQVLWDWHKSEPVRKPDGPDLQGGSRDRSDPSYALFQHQ